VWQTMLDSGGLGVGRPSLVLAVLADVWLKWRSGDGANVWTLLGGVIGFPLLPLTGLAMVAIPALDAHSRLLFGRSLACQVTEKGPRPASFRPRAIESTASS